MRIPTASHVRRRLAAEQGVILIETLVAAAVLVAVIVAVLATLDTASSATASNRGRTVAAALAEQDQERLRGMRTADLQNLPAAPRTVTVAGVDYSVASSADWVRDATSGAANCTSNSSQADYLRLTSTVTSNVVGTRIKPVEMRSLIAPRVGDGTLAVKVTDQTDAAVSGITVSISGPSGATAATNSQGCAVFAHIDPGDYAVRVSRPGWVDPAGNPVAQTAGTVTAGTVNVVSLRYAEAASVAVSFDSKRGPSAAQSDTSVAITAANSGIPSPGTRVFTEPAPQRTIVATQLFPFTDGYTFYSGSCASAKPTLYDPSYFAANPGFVAVTPGGSAAVTVREPALDLRVTRANGGNGKPPLQAAHVLVRSESAGCNDVFEFDGLDTNGELPEPGLPFGIYTVCADDSPLDPSNPSAAHSVTATGVRLDDPAGLAPKLDLPIDAAAGPTGKCT